MFKSIALAALIIAAAFTGTATAGTCNLKCDGKPYVDFTNSDHIEKLGWKDAKVAKDYDSCKSLIDRSSVEASEFLISQRALKCPQGEVDVPHKGLKSVKN